MSPIIHFECRNPAHRSARSAGVGSIVMHHGTLGHCDGFATDSDHRWIPTGGVFLEQLIKEDRDDRGDDARYVPHHIGHAGPLPAGR
jgi:hypothetical protein